MVLANTGFGKQMSPLFGLLTSFKNILLCRSAKDRLVVYKLCQREKEMLLRQN
jgi:hypothetical protein